MSSIRKEEKDTAKGYNKLSATMDEEIATLPNTKLLDNSSIITVTRGKCAME